MEPISMADVVDRLDEQDEPFLEFFRHDSMSLEVYRLGVGATDGQSPHTEDEVYYILSGTAKIRIDDEVHPVAEGDVIFVERNVEHSFIDITEELITLIFFAPPYNSLADT